MTLGYQVTAARQGEFTIPALTIHVDGKPYQTQPIKLTVDKPGTHSQFQDMLFGKVQLTAQRIYIGQVVPVSILIFARQNLPIHNLVDLSVETEGFEYKYLPTIKSVSQVINGETFNIYIIEGALTATRSGQLNFGPGTIKAQILFNRRDQLAQFLQGPEVRETPVSIEAVPLEVLPLPTEGRPADFHGAVGQWNLDVTAKPTEVAVGDPITFTVTIKGLGNINTVPPVKLTGIEAFKTYDPTTRTTNDELHTQGERVFQQVLIAKDTTVSNLPAVRLSYFDPVAGAYKTASHDSIPIMVKAGTGGRPTVLEGGHYDQSTVNLGQDIVYLKGDLGTVPGGSLVGTPIFWSLNVFPILGLAGALTWKRRADRLAGDVAYARRSRAAREARKILAAGADHEHVQRALQEYLGDRLNIPSSGITAAVVDEQLAPRGMDGTVASEIRRIFEVCDAARFSRVPADGGSLAAEQLNG